MACEHNDVKQTRQVLKSLTIDELNKLEINEETTALHIASENACYDIVQLLLDHGDCMIKRDRHGLTPFNQAKDERMKRIFAQC